MNESCNRSKKKLLVILGAGSSIPYEMPSVVCINKHMLDWSNEWESSDRIYKGKNIFKHLMDDNSDYELVLGQMTTLIYVLSPQTSGIRLFENIKNQFVDCSVNIGDLRNTIIEQHKYLIEKLACYFRTCCKKGPTKERLSGYSIFLRELRKHFEVGIYNLNHDNIAIKAWPEAFKGFVSVDSKQSSCLQINGSYFDPMGIFNRKKWNFIYHLHGSVHFNFSNENAERTQIKWEENLCENKFLDYFVPVPAQDDKSMHLPFTTLITGGSKLEQLLPEPYHTFHASLARHSHEADAILIAGYSFGDLHVNRALKNRFDPNFSPKTLPKVVILQKNCRDKSQTSIARPDWARQMYKTFNTLFNAIPDKDNDNRTIGDVLTCDDFEEISSQIVICHKGTEDAFSDAKRVISRLE